MSPWLIFGILAGVAWLAMLVWDEIGYQQAKREKRAKIAGER